MLEEGEGGQNRPLWKPPTGKGPNKIFCKRDSVSKGGKRLVSAIIASEPLDSGTDAWRVNQPIYPPDCDVASLALPQLVSAR